MKYKVGDVVVTTKDIDCEGSKVFPVGTIGRICSIEEGEQMPYVIEAAGVSWIYSEDMFEPYRHSANRDLNDETKLLEKLLDVTLLLPDEY